LARPARPGAVAAARLPTEVVARIAERTHSPVLRSADLLQVQVPWWEGRRLRFEIAVGKTK
jgi:hypothetical protein